MKPSKHFQICVTFESWMCTISSLNKGNQGRYTESFETVHLEPSSSFPSNVNRPPIGTQTREAKLSKGKRPQEFVRDQTTSIIIKLFFFQKARHRSESVYSNLYFQTSIEGVASKSSLVVVDSLNMHEPFNAGYPYPCFDGYWNDRSHHQNDRSHHQNGIPQ